MLLALSASNPSGIACLCELSCPEYEIGRGLGRPPLLRGWTDVSALGASVGDVGESQGLEGETGEELLVVGEDNSD